MTISTGAILGSGLFFTLYGIAGLLGVQKIHEKYKNHDWTPKYIRTQGAMFLLLGAPWLIFGVLTFGERLDLLTYLLIMLACAIPSLILALLVDRKFKKLLEAPKE